MNASAAMRTRLRTLPLLIGACFASGAAIANPAGPQVVNGQASFAQQGGVLSVTNTPGSIINWQSFSINPGEITRFIQQSASSSVLNRVVGQDPSQILGALQSNGRVFLINPNGILFGAGAQIDVNGLVASTLNISNEDFLAGRRNFKSGDKAGNLQNQGAITTPAGGQVYLIAPNVENSGIISSPKGDVVLAAGHSVQLVDSANPDLHVVVSAPEDRALNLGQIVAQGGRIGIYGALINQRGVVNADSAVIGENGKIVFKASRDTIVEAGSVTSATGEGKGGDIKILGERVGLTGDAKVDASGKAGGGSVLIGGDYQGKNIEVQNAKRTYVGQDVDVKADAIDAGDGGKVIVWADEATRMEGRISARGGAQSGNGGFAEVSGKQSLDFTGRADLRAPNGSVGNLLLDPTDITIQASGSTDLLGNLGLDFLFNGNSPLGILKISDLIGQLLNSNVTVSTAGAGTATNGGKITVADALSWASGNTLTLRADTDIAVNAAITGGAGSILNLSAGNGGTTGNIALNASISVGSGGTIGIRTDHGNITQSSGSISAPNLVAYAGAGSVTLNSTSNSVTTLAGYAGGAGGFKFTNAGGFSVDEVSTGIVGSSKGIRTADQAVTLTALTGDLAVKDTSVGGGYGIDAGTADVSLTATTGKVWETSGGKVTTSGTLSVTAATDINFSGGSTAVGTFSATQTNTSGAGSIALVNNRALTLKSISQATTASSSISITTTGSNNITVANGVSTSSSGSSISLTAGTSGSIYQGASGLLSADNINLQLDSTGAIGQSGTPLLTSSVGGNSLLRFGNSSGPSAIYLKHTGDASLYWPVVLGANATVDLEATHDLTLTSVNSGTGNQSYKAGNLLTLPAEKTLAASNADIVLAADRMKLLGEISNAGLTWLKPFSAGRAIDLGSAVDTGNALELSTDETRIVDGHGLGTLRIGSLTSGDMHISDGISPYNVDVLSLQSGGNITQAAPIYTGRLAISALGNVTLDSADNLVDRIAANVGDGTHLNRSFKLVTADSLTIADGLDGLSGITIQKDGAAFDPQNPNGVISLVSGIELTQDANALLSAKALYAKSGVVDLTEANPTGVIAGSAEGYMGDGVFPGVFSYTGSNGVIVSTVNGVSGVTVNDGLIQLESLAGDIRIDKPVNSGNSGVLLTAPGSITGGDVIGAILFADAGNGINLTTRINGLHATNTGAASAIDIVNVGDLALYDVVQFDEGGSGAISINNTGSLAVAGGSGVSAYGGNVSLVAHSPLTVFAPVTTTSGSITLEAGASGSGNDILTIAGPVSSTSGNILLKAGDSIAMLAGGSVVSGSGTVTQLQGVHAPTLDQCILNPSLAGCGAVLPTLNQCVANPSLAGCIAVLPTLAGCIANPSAPGCEAVLPPQQPETQSPAPVAIDNATKSVTTLTAAVAETVLPTAADKNGSKKESKEENTISKVDGAKKNEAAKKMYCN